MSHVTAVVCAAFDPATDEAILRVREIVRRAGVALADHAPHRPHLSMAAATVDDDRLDDVVSVAAQVARRHAVVPVTLSEVGRFGRAGAVWLGPSDDARLARLQQDVHDSLAARWPSAFGVRSDPQQWRAHCTLATRLPMPLLRRVQSQVDAAYAPIRGTVDAVATILVGGRGDVAHIRLVDQPG